MMNAEEGGQNPENAVTKKHICLSGRTISTDNCAFVMGIVNATPDSFFSHSRGGLDLALELIDQGADILDIGGESTRPGASYIDEAEELKRVVPLVKKIRKYSDIPVSIDTRKKNVMEAAFNEGADLLNDVSALEDDEAMADFVSSHGLSVILMHKRPNADIIHSDAHGTDVFREVNDYLMGRMKFAESHGISPSSVIVDPGVGFGKNLEENKTLIARCGELCGGAVPVLMGLSRKSCIGQLTGRTAEDRLSGTLAADLFAVAKGASIIRVHDVAAALDTLKVYSALLKSEVNK